MRFYSLHNFHIYKVLNGSDDEDIVFYICRRLVVVTCILSCFMLAWVYSARYLYSQSYSNSGGREDHLLFFDIFHILG